MAGALRAGGADPARLEAAEQRAARDGTSLVEALVAEEAVPRGELLAALQDVHGVPAVDLRSILGDPLTLELIPKDVAKELQVVTLWSVERQLTVAMADTDDLAVIDRLRFVTGHDILPCVALPGDLRQHLSETYGAADASLGPELAFGAPSDEEDTAGLDLNGESVGRPVVRLVDIVLARALDEGASDVHLEPRRSRLIVRYRIDGLLQVKQHRIPASVSPAVVSRIKVLAGLDISERRVPQDGRIRVRFGGRAIDVRVSTFPTIRGEKVVMRLLDRDRTGFDLDGLGMRSEVLTSWQRLVRRHEGVILVSGPTGSGKTTTLHATLRELNREDVNVVTLEDPVEYELEGVSQAQVHDRCGFTFARGLRSVLRQDPDIILVGEIRDGETAQIAVQAALTGHLVLATLHTNDAPSTVTRLVDLGLAPFLVASSVLGIVAQRLVRRPCVHCSQAVEPSKEDREILGPWLDVPGLPFIHGDGCGRCRGTGHQGRIAVHEVLETNARVRTLVGRGAGEAELATAAAGYRAMWHDGVAKVRDGLTTLRELARVVDVPEQDEAVPGGSDVGE